MLLYDRIIKAEFITATGITYSFDDLRIAYRVECTDTSEANSLELSIYNLSDQTKSLLLRVCKKVMLYVGYQVPTRIFYGDVTSMSDQILPTDIVFKVTAGESAAKLQESKVSLSFSPGATYKTVLAGLVSSFGLPSIVDIKTTMDKVLSNGYSYTGMTSAAMTKLCKTLGVSWSIQGDVVVVYDKSIPRAVPIISVSSGLIGSPTKIRITENKKEIHGWEVSSLVNPGIVPGSNIIVSSKQLQNKLLRVKRVTHTGDSHGGDNLSLTQAVEG